jgi:hypothetical protein
MMLPIAPSPISPRLESVHRLLGPNATRSPSVGNSVNVTDQEVSMGKVENIEQEIQDLTPSELATFRRWFLEFDAQVWDRQIEEDVRKGKLDKLADEALAAHRAGKSKEL